MFLVDKNNQEITNVKVYNKIYFVPRGYFIHNTTSNDCIFYYDTKEEAQNEFLRFVKALEENKKIFYLSNI